MSTIQITIKRSNSIENTEEFIRKIKEVVGDSGLVEIRDESGEPISDGVTVAITPEKCEEYFYNALCNIGGQMSGYGLQLNYDDQFYEMARVRLTNPAFEDVLMQMLRMGYWLEFEDIEGDGDQTRRITMKEVYERVPKSPSIMDMVEENDDANTADDLLQTVFWGEIIFG